MANEKQRLYIREFLNLPHHHTSAFIHLTVEDTTEVVGQRPWSNIHCEIADCHDRVHLSFEFGTAAERRNSIRKARILAHSFAAFAAAIEDEAATCAARIATYKKKKKDLKNEPLGDD